MPGKYKIIPVIVYVSVLAVFSCGRQEEPGQEEREEVVVMINIIQRLLWKPNSVYWN